jgi:hypothetical protein|uniref:Uncharacterized protein n=1 Tax=viral metagenome TaxID=1070528 RepID=A0A6C0ALP4_9ZZZZ
MLYSLTILLIGIYLGQEFNLPRIKQLCVQEHQNSQPNLQNGYIERFVNFILN